MSLGDILKQPKSVGQVDNLAFTHIFSEMPRPGALPTAGVARNVSLPGARPGHP
jgi:hypothetical protein